MICLVYILLEAITVLVCLHTLYGKKLHKDLYSVLFLMLDCIMMSAIKICGMNQNVSLLIYPIIIGYCFLEFKTSIREVIINIVLLAIIMTSAQLLVSTVFSRFYQAERIYEDVVIIVINTVVLIVNIFLYKKVNLHALSIYFQRREVLIGMTLLLESGLIFFLLFHYKNFQGMVPAQYIAVGGILIFIIILCFNGLLYKVKYQENQLELDVYKTYSAVFEELITDIRTKQHEFDNHVNALCNLHYVCKDYDELVQEQSQYAKDVVNDNKFNKLLTSGNPVLSGFLYGRFRTIESIGIYVSYKFCVSGFQCKVPIYLVIELIGNLLNNAVEALSRENIEKELYVACIEEEKMIRIIVRNISRKISFDEMGRFFERGYSSKGEKRGLGLYHVKKICDDYGIDIICENRQIDEKNWLTFELHIKKDKLYV